MKCIRNIEYGHLSATYAAGYLKQAKARTSFFGVGASVQHVHTASPLQAQMSVKLIRAISNLASDWHALD